MLYNVAGLPIGVFQSMFSVVALETFELPAEQNGYLLSYVGILTMVIILTAFPAGVHKIHKICLPLFNFFLWTFQIVQGLGVGIVTKKYSENDILKWSSFLLVWSYLALVRFKHVVYIEELKILEL